MSIRGALTGLMYDIRNCKFEVTVQAWQRLVVLSFMAESIWTACTGAGKKWHKERSRAGKLTPWKRL